MRGAIRKHLVDFLAVLGLIAIAAVAAVIILANQRLALPSWTPFIGEDHYEIQAELSTAQAVTPGQGQTVNIAGVQVGEISRVRLEDGRAIVGLRLKEKYDGRIYRDASVLLRPKTGLKDMVAELTPGTRRAGRLPDGGRIPVSQTLPDVNLDEILASLDADTRDFLQLLLGDGAEGLRDNGPALANAIRRFEPTSRELRRVGEALEVRDRNISRVIHNFSLLTEELGSKDRQLAEFVENSNGVFSILARQDSNLQATLRELPGALRTTRTALDKSERLANELGPTLQALRPGARALGPTQRALRPFLRDTTPIIRDELRPFTRDVRPVVSDLRPTLHDLSRAAPDLTTSFEVVNRLFNMLAYNPPGGAEGYLFWVSWLNHLGATIFATQDAHGPIRRGMVMMTCSTRRIVNTVAGSNPALGTLIGLLNPPPVEGNC
jgi:phospholipid/cholesterol/gamma-HCH transport system substrate-binding protein